MKTTIYLIRHAESVANARGLYGGITNYPLSEYGHQQARDLATKLAGVGIDYIYSSPLTRTCQTIMPFAERASKEIIIEPNLIEVNVGAWEGIKWSELLRNYPDEVRYIKATEHHTGMLGGENYADMAARMYNALEKIAMSHPGKAVIAQSHAQAIRAFLCKVGNISFSQIKEKIGDIPNTSITSLEYDFGARKFKVKAIGQESITDELIYVVKCDNLVYN